MRSFHYFPNLKDSFHWLLRMLKYSGHAKSMESIESAYNEIMMEKQVPVEKKEVKEMPAWMHRIAGMYHVPKVDVIAKTTAFYAALGLWTMLKPVGGGGPAFQVSTC